MLWIVSFCFGILTLSTLSTAIAGEAGFSILPEQSKPSHSPVATACASNTSPAFRFLGNRAQAAFQRINLGAEGFEALATTTQRFDEWLFANQFGLIPYGGSSGPVRLTAMGRVAATAATPAYTVWRMRNATDNLQRVTLRANNGAFRFDTALPPRSEGFVFSTVTGGSATHILQWPGGSSTKAASTATFSYSLPIYTGEQDLLIGINAFIDEFIPFARDNSDLEFLEAWRAEMHRHFLQTILIGPSAANALVKSSAGETDAAVIGFNQIMDGIASQPLSPEELALLETWREQIAAALITLESDADAGKQHSIFGDRVDRQQALIELQALIEEFIAHAHSSGIASATAPSVNGTIPLPPLPFLVCAPEVAAVIQNCTACGLNIIIRLLTGDYAGALEALRGCIANPTAGLNCLLSYYRLARCIARNSPALRQLPCEGTVCPRNCELVDPSSQLGDESIVCCPSDYDLERIPGTNDYECKAQCEIVPGEGCTGGTLTIRYTWSSAAGRDLDTRTALQNPAINDDVGWSRGNVDASGVLTWTGDNTSQGGSETVLVNVDQLLANYPNQDDFRIRLRAFWFGERGTGDVDLSLSGCGTLVQTQQNIVTQQSANIDGEDVGFVILSRDGSFGFEESECPQ
ncbi:MAG: hypothetical protein Tsb002_29710 [Wenzhouxiangellaceae bacterium]